MRTTNRMVPASTPGQIVDHAWMGTAPFLDPFARRRRDPEASL